MYSSGTQLPDITLLEELGRGDHAVVFRAKRGQDPCLVKLPVDRSHQATETFARDALALARVSSPALPRTLRVETASPLPYVILEAIGEKSLARLSHIGLGAEQLLCITQQLVATLERLHQSGFARVFFTPEQVLWSPETSQVSLIDYGSLTRLTPTRGTEAKSLERHREAQASDRRRLAQLVRNCSAPNQRCVQHAPLQACLELLEASHIDLGRVRESIEALSTGETKTSSYPRPPRHEGLYLPLHRSSTRDAILQLRGALRRIDSQENGIIEVAGPAGIGKSHLLSSFAEEASTTGAMVLTMRCRETDWKPFSALKRMLHEHIRSMDELPIQRRQEMLEVLRQAAGEMLPWLGLLIPELGPAPSARNYHNEVGQLQRMFAEGVAEFLERYLRACPPAIWVVEDVQWLEGSSRDVLARVSAHLRGQGMLLIYSCRDDDHSRATVADIMRMVDPLRIQQLALPQLNEAEAGRIIQAYLGTESPPRSQLVRQLSRLCDRTPVSLLDLLERTLEAGCLTPAWGQWQLDASAAQQLQRPEGTAGHASCRLQELDPQDRAVLQAFALASAALPTSLLAQALGLTDNDVLQSLRRCRERHVLHCHSDGRFHFVHNSLQDAVLQSIDEEQRRRLHYQLSGALKHYEKLDPELICELSRHHAGADSLADPREVYLIARQAAEHALNSYDDPRTLQFLQHAERAAKRANIVLDTEFHQVLAESYWRNGQPTASLAAYELALTPALAPVVRARILGRMAWVYNYAANSEKAIVCLRQAFASMGAPLPQHLEVGLTTALLRWSGNRVPQMLRRALAVQTAPQEGRERDKVLCALYFRAYRIFTEHGHLTEAVYCAVEADRYAALLPASQTAFMAQASVATLMARVGLRERALQRLDRVEHDAIKLGEPVSATRCAQMRNVILGWLGDVDAARHSAHACAVERSHFMELGEFVLLCFGMYILETVLGQPRAALRWLERILERVTLHGYAPPIMAVIREAVEATLMTLGLERQNSLLRRQLEALPAPESAKTGFLHLMSFPIRLQRLSERGQVDTDFESLVEQFDAAVTEPQRAHPLVTACYAHILQAHIHGTLSGRPAERIHHLQALRRRLRRLDKVVLGPVAKGHMRVAEACRDWYDGKHAEAECHLSEAEKSAHIGPNIIVMYTIARIRAHMLRANGFGAAAVEQARIAAMLAHRHGHQQRLAWISEEFGEEVATEFNSLPSAADIEEKDGRGIQHHLNALLHIGRTATAHLSSERQTQLVLEEVVQSLNADRGLLFLRQGTQLVEVAAIPPHQGMDQSEERLRWSVEGVYATGQRLRINPDSLCSSGPNDSLRPTLITPLVLRGAATGVVCLEREAAHAAFDEQDGDLLEALANQVPIALELAKTLQERERLEEGLRQAQKMEAIGRLAGGIAHDFNNILATIQLAGSALVETLEVHNLGQAELTDILDVTNRGAALTRQLLTFARREVRPPRPVDLNEVVRAVMPMLSRLVGKRVHLSADLEALPRILADTTRLEQVVVNLTTNARDAIPRHGQIVLRTRVVHLDAESGSSQFPPDLPMGDYVQLSVEDNGTGMSTEVQKRIFDPFYTTKPSHQGTGLGLSTVYGIIKQESGYIQVTSQLGHGTRFDLYWPSCDDSREERCDEPAPVEAVHSPS